MTIKNLIENVTIIDGLGNEPFKGNVLKLKEGVVLPEGHNNYEMVFDGDFHDARFR